jgi:plastocyanin
MTKLPRLLLVVLSLVVVVTACGGDDDDGGAAAEPGVVIVGDNKFTPKQAEVAVGDTVTWRFEGKSAHNVTAKDGDFESDLTKEGTFEHTFDEAGTFDYVCRVHPGLCGKIKVTEGGAGGAP